MTALEAKSKVIDEIVDLTKHINDAEELNKLDNDDLIILLEDLESMLKSYIRFLGKFS
jgi:superfamily I DNA and RNA helicase